MKTTKKFILPMIIAFLAMILSACEKESNNQDPGPELGFEEKLQKALDDAIKTYDGKGISLAVILPDGQLVTCVSGISHGSMAISDDMAFSAGSITKMFTAGVFLKYQELDILSLDDSLSNWFPDIDHIDGTITLRQMLNHTCGVYNITENPELWEDVFADPDKTWDLNDVITNYVKEPYFDKGESWHYCNTAYIMLRMIIKQISGKSVAEVYRELLIDPSGLKSTYCSPYESLPTNTSHGWIDLTGDGQYNDLPPESLKSFYSMAGGGIFCTAEDLALWVRKLLHNQEVLTKPSMMEMKDYIFPTPGEDLVEAYGLGLYRFNYDLTNGLDIIGHGGDPVGYAAGAFYLEEYGICIGLMDNTEDGACMPVWEKISKIAIDHIENDI
jgi:D-alanyl-D-alanine carboxypeptidase